MKNWLEEKVESLSSPLQDEERDLREEVGLTDMDLARKEFSRCFKLMQGRNEKYGDSWKVLSIQSIANLIEMKMHRIANLPEGAPKTEDEFQDAVNYSIFALLKLKKCIIIYCYLLCVIIILYLKIYVYLFVYLLYYI